MITVERIFEKRRNERYRDDITVFFSDLKEAIKEDYGFHENIILVIMNIASMTASTSDIKSYEECIKENILIAENTINS